MESSDASRNSPRPAGPTGSPTRIPGQLSPTEEFLYTGARVIDRLLDQVLDRPLRTFAIAVGALGLAFLIPHG